MPAHFQQALSALSILYTFASPCYCHQGNRQIIWVHPINPHILSLGCVIMHMLCVAASNFPFGLSLY